MTKAGSIFIAAATFLPVALAFAAPAAETVTTSTSPESFQIMSQAESEAHRATMAQLSGEARERYRNEQYRKLQARARAQGYVLPETPPWAQPNPSQPSTPNALEARPVDVRQQGHGRSTGAGEEQTKTAADAPLVPRDDEAETGPGEQRTARHAAEDALKPVAQAQPHATEQPGPSQSARWSVPPAAPPLVRPPLSADAATPPREPARATPHEAWGARPMHPEAMRPRFGGDTSARGQPPMDQLGEAGPVAIERRLEAEAAHRQAIQARIDQAIEAMGQPPGFPPAYRSPRPPTGYPPLHGPYHSPY